MDAQSSLDDWVYEVHLRIEFLEELQLPEGLELDFSASSLAGLEAEALDRFGGPGEVSDPGEEPFVEGVVAYLGETLLRMAGGGWGWDETEGSTTLEFLRAAPDEVLGLSAVSPLDLVITAVRGRDGGQFALAYGRWERAVEEYAAAHAGWRPAKAHTPGLDLYIAEPSEFLGSWLAEREREFPGWIDRYGVDGSWDFSSESIDLLVEAVFRVTPTVERFQAPESASFVDGAAWYWGEILRRAAPASWQHEPGERDDRNPFAGYCRVKRVDVKASTTPELNLVYMLERGDRGWLRKLYTDWLA